MQRTPRHFFRHVEPSVLGSGQITSFSASGDTWKEPVRAGLGGIACGYECAGGEVGVVLAENHDVGSRAHSEFTHTLGLGGRYNGRKIVF